MARGPVRTVERAGVATPLNSWRRSATAAGARGHGHAAHRGGVRGVPHLAVGVLAGDRGRPHLGPGVLPVADRSDRLADAGPHAGREHEEVARLAGCRKGHRLGGGAGALDELGCRAGGPGDGQGEGGRVGGRSYRCRSP